MTSNSTKTLNCNCVYKQALNLKLNGYSIFITSDISFCIILLFILDKMNVPLFLLQRNCFAHELSKYLFHPASKRYTNKVIIDN